MKQYDALSPRPTQLQPRPEIARYGEATAHRNFTVIRIPVCTGWQLLVNAYLPYVVVYVCAFHEATTNISVRDKYIVGESSACAISVQAKKAALLVTVSTMLLRRLLVCACYLPLTFASYVSVRRSISIAYH